MSIDAKDIFEVTKKVTKAWTAQRKAEERGSRSRYSRCYIYSDRVNFTDVADGILPEAYLHASGGGKYTVSKRQFYYACREAFKTRTGRELCSKYFSSTLLVQFMNQNPELTAEWKITADPRGSLSIPNAGHSIRIPCGTIDIDNHLRKERKVVDELDIGRLRSEWPSVAAGQRYQAVLYIEKEGFGPMFDEAKIAERYDLAILSCKGQSVVAARKFVDEVCAVGNGVPLLVVHDFDKAGFEISQRLTKVSGWARDQDRVVYEFKNEIDVHDLGLRLADVEKYKLQSERVEFKGGFASDSLCTNEERKFLLSDKRVELNAFTAPQFIEWIESKLDKHLKRRLVPEKEILEAAFRRAEMVAEVNLYIAELCNSPGNPPKTLERMVASKMKEDPNLSWDKAVYEVALDRVSDK